MNLKLSIIIPAYNENAYIGALLEKILSIDTESLGYEKEIIVVDDGSSDGTSDIVEKFAVKLIKQKNKGKGAAVQTGVSASSGDYILVQDADLEYDPADYLVLLAALNIDKNASIYGSRIMGGIGKSGYSSLFPGKHADQSFGPWLAGVALSVWTFLLYQVWISDTLTAYKVYPAKVLKGFNVKTAGFETDHEITSKLIKRGVKIREVPISYIPRSKHEGKKITLLDGFIAVWTLMKFRFID